MMLTQKQHTASMTCQVTCHIIIITIIIVVIIIIIIIAWTLQPDKHIRLQPLSCASTSDLGMTLILM